MIKRKVIAVIINSALSLGIARAQVSDLVSSFENEFLLATNISLSFDTNCVNNSSYFYDEYTGVKSCGILNGRLKIGKWLGFDTKGMLNNVAFYDKNGKDSIYINWISQTNKPGSITFYSNGEFKLSVEYFKGSPNAITKVYSDTLVEEIYFYPSGRVSSYGYFYRNPSPLAGVFMRDNLGYDIRTGKHGTWHYLNEDGTLRESEEYSYGQRIK